MGIASWVGICLVGLRVCAQAQDGCLGANSTLLRVKEEITPNLKDRDELKKMQAALQAAAHRCSHPIPELLYYRKLIADQLSEASEAKYLAGQIKDLQYHADYSNPFTKPESGEAQAKDAPKLGKKWALVIGINRFEDPSIDELRFAAKDANDFAAFLKDPAGGRFVSERVKVLTDNEATLAGFRSGIGWLRDSVKPEDMVVLYVSSHGSAPDDDPNKVSFIATYDTKRTDLFATSMEMIELVQMINREIKALRVVLILDTCYSGDASGAKRLSPVSSSGGTMSAAAAFSGALENLNMGTGRAVITASRGNEVSYENAKVHNGYFTSYLIKELRSGGDKKSIGEIFPIVQQEVVNSVRADYGGRSQTPSSQFSDRAATIVLTVPEGSK